MYDAVEDPYCYRGSTVLINTLGLRDQASLDAFEAEITRQRSSEPLPAGDLDVAHYLAVPHHLFQDVYSWAGQIRSVRIAKDGSMFCYPEHIQAEMTKLFDRLKTANYLKELGHEAFARGAANFVAELNAIRFAKAMAAHNWLSWPCSPPLPAIPLVWNAWKPMNSWPP